MTTEELIPESPQATNPPDSEEVDGEEKSEDAHPHTRIEDLPEALKQACQRMGWQQLMPVQSRTIPYMLEKRDLMVQSRTGSGKTGAFVLPIVDQIDPSKKFVQSLVLVPTRELASQVSAEAERLAAGTGIRQVVVYGGVGYHKQIESLQGGAQLVVGTPGRILDLLGRGTMRLQNLRILVFDEADRLMSMGFYPDMQRLKEFLPVRRCSYMFSATYPQSVLQLAETFLNDPTRLNLSQDSVHVIDTDHVYYVSSSMEKDRDLIRLIEVENPENAIIFCNTKAQVEYVYQVLQRFGYAADQLTSDLNQNAREKALQRLRDKKVRFLVATDLAARGIDIPLLTHVLLFDFPEEPEAYIHRAGRTGRAGAVGVVMSLVRPKEELLLSKTAREFDIQMERRTPPDDVAVQKIVSERATVLLEARLRNRDSLHTERMERFIPLARELAQSEDELAVIAMLLDDDYQQSLNGPPVAPAPSPREFDRPSRKRPPRGRRPRRRRY